MLKSERKYEFRKRLLNIHKKDVRNFDIYAGENEFELRNGVNIVIPENCSEVIITGAKDFTDYLFKSMNVSAMITNEAFSDNAAYVTQAGIPCVDCIGIEGKIFIPEMNMQGWIL